MYCYVDDLKQRLISAWDEFKHSVIDIDQWQADGIVFVHLHNLLIEITVCLLNGFVFTRIVLSNFEFKGKHSHIPFQFIKNSHFQLCKVVWWRYLG